MKTVRLKNGTEEHEVLVSATMLSLNAMMSDIKGIVSVYELVQLCRDKDHNIFSEVQITNLIDLGLLQNNGTVHDSIRNIVLSATNGEGMNITISNPIDQG